MKSEGKLDADAYKKIHEWVEERFKRGAPCQLCGKSEWAIASRSARLPVGGPGRNGFPLIVMVCKWCANTVFLSTIMMGMQEGGRDE